MQYIHQFLLFLSSFYIILYFIFLKISIFYNQLHLLVSRLELWSPRRQFIVFVDQLSFDIITYSVEIWIYYNHIHFL
jgi:hypothetical protein